jgi:uncharacterized membrane protein YkvA (DUF1232 family)
MADKGIVAELYSDESYWDKLSKYATLVGPKLVQDSLVLYYTLKAPATPNRIKAAIMGVLAYFIMPLDAVPDTVVGLGYLDDIGVLAWGYDIVANHIGSNAVTDAARTSRKWFGSDSKPAAGPTANGGAGNSPA